MEQTNIAGTAGAVRVDEIREDVVAIAQRMRTLAHALETADSYEDAAFMAADMLEVWADRLDAHVGLGAE